MFSLENETDTHYLIKHPKGDSLKIAKKGLSQEMHAHIKKMAKGGEVEKPQTPQGDPNPISQGFMNASGMKGIKQAASNIKNYDEGGEVDDSPQTPETEAPARAIASDGQIDPAILDEVRGQREPQGGSTLSGLWNKISAKPELLPGQVPFSSKFQNADEWQKYNQLAAAKNNPVPPTQTPEQPQYTNAVMNQPAQQPQQPAMPIPSSPDYQGAMGNFQQGLAQQRQAQTNVSSQSQQALQQEQQGLQEQHQALLNNVSEMNTHLQHTADDLMTKKIDFNKVWHEKLTGNKILAGIGMMLSGLGSGLTGQPNMALAQINKEIDRDIEAQKQQGENKKTALNTYNQIYHNKELAAQALKLNLQAMTLAKINEITAGQGGLEAKAQENLMKAQYLPEMQQKVMQFAAQKMMLDRAIGQPQGNTQMTGGKPGNSVNATPVSNSQSQAPQANDQTGDYLKYLRVFNAPAAKELEARYLPGIGEAQVPLAKEDRDEITGRVDLDKKLSDLDSFARQHSGTVLDRETVNRGAAMARLAQDAYRRANKQGVFREAEKDFVDKIISDDPTAFFNKYRKSPGYQAAIHDNRNTLATKLQSVGINYRPINVNRR